MKPVLVLNKIDRLITELRFTPSEAYVQLEKLISQINSIIATFRLEDSVVEETRKYESNEEQESTTKRRGSISTVVENMFAPELGNVVFSSASDGWAFRVSDFSRIYAQKLGVSEVDLRRALWGSDYCYDARSKSVKTTKNDGSPKKATKHLFVQLILENIWAVYDAALMNYNLAKIEKIVASLNLKVTPYDMKSKVLKNVLCSVMNKWLPLSTAVLITIAEQIPSPRQSQPRKVKTLLTSNVPSKFEQTETDMKQCNNSKDADTIVVVAKMFSVPAAELPQETHRQLADEHGDSQQSDECLLGFARIYSGCIKVGDKVNLLGPKYDIKSPDQFRAEVTVLSLYIMMGREMMQVFDVPAGNVFGVRTSDSVLYKWATLTSSSYCPSLGSLSQSSFSAVPVVRVAVEPKNPLEMKQLSDGLRLLNQSDASVDVLLQDSGEHVLLAVGELHLERCLRDLRERFAKIEIIVSKPIVPFRETIVRPVDALKISAPVEVYAANETCKMTIRCVSLPKTVVDFMNRNAARIRAVVDDILTSKKADLDTVDDDALIDGTVAEDKQHDCQTLTNELAAILMKSGAPFEDISAENIWSFGPKRSGCNILLHTLAGFERKPWVLENRQNITFSTHPVSRFDNNVIAGFQLATNAGPLCNEAMNGVAVILEDFTLDTSKEHDDVYASHIVAGQIIGAMRDGIRQAFLKWSPRLMLAMYDCEIQTTAEALGRVYGVLNKRRGRILSEEMKEDMSFFVIKSRLPVIESFGFSEEIRTKTSGAAQPQLVFVGWEVLDIDPFWVPATEEELEDLGDKADRENVAKKYMDNVRRRKGLLVEEKLVKDAEKQRTLKIK